MEEIMIRKATTDDVALLQEIGRQTFFETFALHNSEEDMRKYLQTGFADDKMRSELSDSLSDIYFAMDGSRVIGYLKLNFGESQTELQDSRSIEIERIYVLRAYHGKKVGQMLYDKAVEVGLAHALDYVWLGVWEKNERAIAFYTKNGFTAFDKHIFVLGDDRQTDILMKRPLK
ncbi:N-acetyltransferase family protein [Bacteroides sp. AN502(2024)]|uniref:GNAT family N-acetyltransferase n=1 Tax=Bacteroides sp. AN502(2024) TaxID=3160599 RepID=UPI0035176B2A